MIGDVDTIANDVDTAFKSVATTIDPTKLSAWQTDLASYLTWSEQAQKRLQGGFIFGQWFDVPGAYKKALEWASRIRSHAVDAVAAGAVLPNMPSVPDPPHGVGHLSAGGGIGLELDDTTKALIALGLIAVIVVAVR